MLKTMPVMLLTGDDTPTAIETLTSTLGSSLQETSDNAITAIGTVLPYALAVLGAVLVITIGIKIFKRVSGR